MALFPVKYSRAVGAMASLVIPGLALAAATAAPSLSALGWKERSFSGNTQYSLETHGASLVIKGQTQGSASALYRDISVNLEATPVMSWQWKVSNVFDSIDERRKSGDDFPARLYVVYQKGMFKWSTVAINYVWSSENRIGETWESAYTSKSRIVVLRSGENDAGQWMHEERNIVNDFKTLFNIDVTHLNGYALMVDGDNAGGSATAWFSNIAFNAQ